MILQSLDLASWLLTYALHSTLFLASAWLVVRYAKPDHFVRDVIWKTALVGGLITATVQGVLGLQPLGSFAMAPTSAVVERQLDPTLQPDAAGTPADASADPTASPATPTSTPSSPASPQQAPTDFVEVQRGSARDSMPFTTTLALIWLAVAAVLVIAYTARRLVLTGRLGDRRSVDNPRLIALLDDLRASAEVATPIRLTASSAISSPVALGAREICLPAAALDELDPEQLRAMLAHELAHLVRNDPFWLVLACVIERALFFQPLNRVARVGLLHSAEYLADEWAARRAGGVPLAKALVKVAEWIQASPLGVPVAGFAEERSQLTVRVSRLLDRAAWGTPKSRWGISMVTVAALLLMTAFAPGVVRESAARVASGGPTPIESGDEAPVSQPSAPDSESAAAASRVFRDESPRFSLRSQGDTSLVAAVILRLKDEDAEVRRTAANALGRMQNRRAIDPLVAALEDESEEVRHAALEALSNFENGVPAAPIRRLLASPDNEMRAYAVNILGEMKDRASIPAITQLTTDAQEEVRHQALHALERMDAPIEESVIARVLEDREPDLRQQGASIAGDRRMTSLVPRLIVMLDDASGEVREQAAHALTEMKTDASHRALRLAITHRDAKVRRIAVAYLGDQEDK